MNLAIAGEFDGSGLKGIAGLVGPNFGLGALSPGSAFRAASEVSGLSECERAGLLFPEANDICVAVRERLVCPVGSLRSYILSFELGAAASRPWPWRNTLLDDGSGGSSDDVPGVSGWSLDALPPWDEAGPTGDGDGFTNLTDCDNEDDAEVPVLPPYDGYSGLACDAAGGSCYLCPPGSVLPGPASEPDEPTPSPEPLPAGCAATGCGVPWNCGGGGAVVAFVLAIVPLRRRPQGTSRAHRTPSRQDLAAA